LEKALGIIIPFHDFYGKGITNWLAVKCCYQPLLLRHPLSVFCILCNIGIIIKYRNPEKAAQILQDIAAAGCTAAMEKEVLSPF
jgi:hypothetical protein